MRLRKGEGNVLVNLGNGAGQELVGERVRLLLLHLQLVRLLGQRHREYLDGHRGVPAAAKNSHYFEFNSFRE